MLTATLLALALSLQAAPSSPRLAALAQEVAAGRSDAVERFWTELKGQGTPLYEPGADAEHTLVTFVWRGAPELRNVVVNCDAAGSLAEMQLARLASTDVWYRSYSLPSSAQFYYQFSPDDSLVPFPEEKDWGARSKNFVADPLNPKGIVIGGKQPFSFAILPGTPVLDVYAEHEGVVEGRFEPQPRGAFQLHSDSLGDHKLWLYTTPGLASEGGPANLVLFLDGSGAWQLLPSRRMLDNLFDAGQIGPTIAVYVDSPDRERDLACSDAYLEFLVGTVLPWVRERYRLELAPERTVISGRSLGGLFAGYACLKRPDLFGCAMMQSPSLWWGAARDGKNEWLTREFAAHERVAARFFVAPGLFETAANSPTSISILEASRHFRDVLREKGYAVEYREVPGGHDPLNWQVSLPGAIEHFVAEK